MAPRFLFLPVSGTTGGGEFTRCLTVAGGVQASLPQAQIEFVLNREAGYAQDCPYTTHHIDASPTYATAAVNELLAARRPDVAVFDNSGRGAQLRLAKELGARTVFVSSRASTRAKGFGLRRLPWLDQHWIVGLPLTRPDLSTIERVKLGAVHRPEILFVDWIFVPPQPGRSAHLFERFGVEPEGFLVANAGSGGKDARRQSPVGVFAQAAGRIAARTGLRAIVVCGHNYKGPALDDEGVLFVDTVSRQEMVDLISSARLLITNGGSLFIEGLAFERLCVAVSLANDQETRVRILSEAGLAVSAPLEVGAIARAALAALEQPATLAGILQRLRERPITNGLDTVLGGLHRLLDA